MRISIPSLLLFSFFILLNVSLANAPDAAFLQEYHEAYQLPGDAEANDVRAVETDGQSGLWAGTRDGLLIFKNGIWSKVEGLRGPVYDLCMGESGEVWAAAWDGLYAVCEGEVTKMSAIPSAIAAIGPLSDGWLAVGPDGAWLYRDEKWKPLPKRFSYNVRDIAPDPSGGGWIASALGLYRLSGDTIRVYIEENEITYGECNALAVDDAGRLWVGSFGGIDVFENGVRVRTFMGKDGLPWFDVRSLTFAPDGTLWIGTGRGAVQYKEGRWALRHSRRWLLSDDVRDIAVDREGTAWIATAEGVSAIRRRSMTLQQKAGYFQDILEKRHIRPPGFVEKCYFPHPHDRSRFEPWDDDNDGQYTSMYMVMESLRYAVTGDPEAKARADRAFDALAMLQTITETPHFVARTIIPADWTRMADSNETIPPEEAAERRVRDPRYKPVERRWRLSADGRWLWKGDTSSDEITGHFFGYYFYYKLAADESRRERVRQLVTRIMDGIIEGGYVLRDIDGQPTRWGVWSPERLNDDPDWRVERPINSFEILSYLKTAHFITGRDKYQKEYLSLIREHGYLENCRRPKTYTRSDRTHIDDELLALAAPGLLLNEEDDGRRRIYLEGLTWAYRTVENEQNPFFHFIYGLVGGKNFHLEESIVFLRDHPLDLIQWRIDNGWRDDVTLARWPLTEPMQLTRMLPPSERGIMRWDKNPWPVISGDISDEEGRFESCGVHWLLPYWLGRYAGFISHLNP